MRPFLVAVALALVVASCGSEGSEETTTTVEPLAGPRSVVSSWIEAVIAADAEGLTEVVEPAGLIVLAAIENGYTEAETAALLESGLPPDLVTEYWTSFRAGFADFAGFAFQSIDVGAKEEFMLGDVAYASVVISSGDGVTTVMTGHRGAEWKLDLIGSFGAAFAAQLRRMLINLSDSDAAERIREAYRTDVVPGLLAALRRAPGNRVLGAELERMALLLER